VQLVVIAVKYLVDRITIMAFAALCGAFIYPYTLDTGLGIYAAAFFKQLCVQAALRVLPIYVI
jgi:hypothetical protein